MVKTIRDIALSSTHTGAGNCTITICPRIIRKRFRGRKNKFRATPSRFVGE
jgi:hypothetical protein